MDKEFLSNFLNQYCRLVKDDDFIIWGKVKAVNDEGIIFFTDGKTVFLAYSRIKEIARLRGRK